MSPERHIILGFGGSIGYPLADELHSQQRSVKLVSRKGAGPPGFESVAGDVTDLGSLRAVIEDNAIVYLLVGLKYDLRVWRLQWPVIMRNVIEACSEHKARLIFFDNVYAYGRVDGPMTEATPVNPTSKKGEVRAQIAELLMSAVAQGKLKALIARAADFYGPYADRSSLPFLFYFSRLARKQSAQIVANPHTKHSYTYTRDCGPALRLLAEAEDTWNQIWHLPTAAPAVSSKEFVELTAGALGVPCEYTVLYPWMVRMAGLFNREVHEAYEMLYQNRYNYEFDSTKFERRFGVTATPYRKGIEETIAHFRDRGILIKE